MQVVELSRNGRALRGRIVLAGSKSISNRALIIRALCAEDFPIHRLANAQDTVTMQALLASQDSLLDVGAAGTTFRFLTAYLATRPGTQILTGSERMQQRPIGVLVDALRELGAVIEYLGQEGYPPLRIHAPQQLGQRRQLKIPAGTSSQYISALLLLAPTLPQGLELELVGEIVSRPYIEMTLGMMAYFGIRYEWQAQTIVVPPQAYQAKPFTVEADWSAASYYYSLAALSDTCELQVEGLFADSLQGDAVLQQMYREFGVSTEFTEMGVWLRKAAEAKLPETFEYDFLECPDVAQTLAATCAGLGVTALFTGLQTLRIKETDRIAALQTELAKVNCFLTKLPARFAPASSTEYYLLEGKASWESPPVFATYEDHRMAMALAPLALFGPIRIAEPAVVRKSYPDFWRDLQRLNFTVSTVDL
ncbi:MAG: 3-phosphoshikimate 1-carboxyvinyltransferase [Bacteroidetes bacterium]|nr:MAG: 3-phosphoshikimate 1-carboxyvinyltransferase [Bacteroidota bacterium]